MNISSENKKSIKRSFINKFLKNKKILSISNNIVEKILLSQINQSINLNFLFIANIENRLETAKDINYYIDVDDKNFNTRMIRPSNNDMIDMVNFCNLINEINLDHKVDANIL